MLDLDSDGDEIPDALEGFGDTDANGTPDFLDAGTSTTNRPASGTGFDLETGSDSIAEGNISERNNASDGNEQNIVSEQNSNREPDNSLFAQDDVVPDDATNLDYDGDGISNGAEGSADTDEDSVPDYLDLDSDNDGITDVIEAGGIDENHDGINDSGSILPSPLPDFDGDLLPNYIDHDSDNDGLQTSWK